MSINFKRSMIALAFVLMLSPVVHAFTAAGNKHHTSTSTSASADKSSKKKDDVDKDDDSNLKEGLFLLYDEISDESVSDLTEEMEKWDANPKHDKLPIRIVMCSPGGSVIHGFALMDEIAKLRSEGHHVTISAYGMAASAAGWILQAADTRSIGANSWILIHQVSSDNSGKLVELQHSLQFTTQLQDEFIAMLVKRSHLTLEEVHAHIDNGQDWWIPADEALRLGLVDVVEPVPAYK